VNDAMKQKETGGVQAASARTYDKPRAHDEQRGEQAGFHARVPPCNSVPFQGSMFPCCMTPYSHADLPFKFPHRNSGGPANV
jgi:hypothetical protein